MRNLQEGASFDSGIVLDPWTGHSGRDAETCSKSYELDYKPISLNASFATKKAGATTHKKSSPLQSGNVPRLSSDNYWARQHE